jgi:hypothetical protein
MPSSEAEINKIAEFLQEQPGSILAYDEQLVRWLIERVMAFLDTVSEEFKLDVEIKVDRYENITNWDCIIFFVFMLIYIKFKYILITIL